MDTLRATLCRSLLLLGVLAAAASLVPAALACDETENDNQCEANQQFDPRTGLCVTPSS